MYTTLISHTSASLNNVHDQHIIFRACGKYLCSITKTLNKITIQKPKKATPPKLENNFVNVLRVLGRK